MPHTRRTISGKFQFASYKTHIFQYISVCHIQDSLFPVYFSLPHTRFTITGIFQFATYRTHYFRYISVCHIQDSILLLHFSLPHTRLTITSIFQFATYMTHYYRYISVCHVQDSLSSTDDTLTCSLSTCLSMDCCINVHQLQRTLALKLDIDNCDKNIHIEIDNYNVDMSLIAFEWNKLHNISIKGIVRLM